MRLPLAALPLCLAAATASAASPEEIVYATVHDAHPGARARLGARFAHVVVDRERGTAGVETTLAEVAALERDGYRVTLDAAATAKLREEASAFATDRAKRIPGFACYRTVEETYATMDALAETHPELARVVAIGPTWERTRDAARGYPMRALVLGNRATDAAYADKPSMVVTSAIHAREYTTAELMTRFGEWLVEGYGTNAEATWLMDHYRFHLVLHANPDGRKIAETGVLWRKNTNTTNGTCANNRPGIDLNRNFPFHWNFAPLGSSGDPCIETYRGPTAGSEPETQNLVRYVAGSPGANGVYTGGVLPDRRDDSPTAAAPADYRGLYLDVHSAAQLVLWPWGDTTTPAPNDAALRTLGRRLGWQSGYFPIPIHELYPADGSTVDTIYGVLGAPSFAFELGLSFFESCAAFEADTLPANLAALRYAARSLEAPYRLPAGPDVASIAASATSVAAGTTLTLDATLDDTRYNQENGVEPVHAIAGVAAYVDRLPWEPGAVAIPLAPVDGAFDTPQEAVRGAIATAGLAPGAHFVYVQGADAAGQRGTPNAVRVVVQGEAQAKQTGWYWSPQESGRGFFIEEDAGAVYMAAFHFGAAGDATWFVGLGRHDGNALQSPMHTFANGQTLTGAYVAPTSTPSPGNLRLDFAAPGAVTLTWPGGVVPLTRFPFGQANTIVPPQSGAPESGWWWYDRESGRGFALEFQGDALFAAGFLYGADGRPTWYVTGGRMETPRRYAGRWLAFRDGQAIGAPYRAPTAVEPGPGEVRLEFSDARHATLTLPDGRTIPLTRFDF